MKTISDMSRKLALKGTGFEVTGPTPYLSGFRGRLLQVSIAFGWMSKGGKYDDRTFLQRTIKNDQAKWHFCKAFK